VKLLREKGMIVRLYTMAKSTRVSEKEHPTAYVVAESKTEKHVALVTLDPKEKLDQHEDAWQDREYHELAEEARRYAKRLEFIDEGLSRLSAYRTAAGAYIASLEKKREFLAVKSGAGEESGVVYITGFLPTAQKEHFTALAVQQPWGFAVEDVDLVCHDHSHGRVDEAHPPTMLNNSPWAAVAEPLFRFMGTIPGYREYDISVCFLVFFSLFFAMIMGDASYGVILLGLGAWGFFKAKSAEAKKAFGLLMTLSTADIIWGALIGEWFASKAIAHVPFFKSMAVLEHMFESPTLMMKFCFTIAAIHLTVAHLMNFLRHKLSRHGMGQIGWILIVWPLYFLVCNMVAGDALPPWALPVLGVGMVLLLASEKTAADFAHAPLAVIGCFSDIISYMRLFAVGFAGSIMAKSFNQMAVGEGIHTISALAIAVVVLVGGHALNLALGLMAVIVHGVRLNLLEFSTHLGQEWTGYEYKPFKE
jgi:V/A-type H+-transporting ATPase subunit I